MTATAFGAVNAAAALFPTPVKTASFTAAPGDFVPVNLTSGSFPVILPNAPAAGTRVGVVVTDAPVTGSAAVTISAQGTDVIGESGGAGSMTLTFPGTAAVLLYASGVWSVTSGTFPLASLDSRYLGLQASGDQSGNTDTEAVTALLADGGSAKLGPGTFFFNSPLTLPNGGTLMGAGTGVTQLVMTNGFTGAALVEITGNNDQTVADLTIKSNTGLSSSAAAANGINVAHAGRVAIRSVLGFALNGFLVDIQSDATADSFYPVLDTVHALQCKAGVLLQGTNSSDHSMGAYLTNCTLEQCQDGDGLLIEDVWDVTVVNLEGSTVTGGSTVHIKGTGGGHYFSSMDIGTLNGSTSTPTAVPTMLIEAGTLGSPFSISVGQSLIEDGSPALQITAGEEIMFTGCQFLKGGGSGVSVSGSASRVHFDACTFDQNNFGGGSDGFDLMWSASGKLLVTGCFFCTPAGTGAGEVTAAADTTAGTTWFLSNFFDGATAFSVGFPSVTRSNAGWNPVGPLTAPTPVTPSGTALTCPFGVDCTIYIKAASTSTVAVAIEGTTVVTIPESGIGTIRLIPGQTITLTYTVVPTWEWTGE